MQSASQLALLSPIKSIEVFRRRDAVNIYCSSIVLGQEGISCNRPAFVSCNLFVQSFNWMYL